jgi:hypothetical protein
MPFQGIFVDARLRQDPGRIYRARTSYDGDKILFDPRSQKYPARSRIADTHLPHSRRTRILITKKGISAGNPALETISRLSVS